MKSAATPWGQDRRLQFIDFRLCWEGHLNRADLTGFFGISVPQASLDLAKYIELSPKNLIYDRSTRRYVAGADFSPLYATTGHPSKYLNELLATVTGVLDPKSSLLGWMPPIGMVPTPNRQLDVAVLFSLLKAIRDRNTVQVVYQSMSRAEPTVRSLSPHAIAHDGFRWHVRAYCHTRERFLDFVIARVHAVRASSEANRPADEDVEWNHFVEVVLAANPALPEPHRRAVELDYGMTEGKVVLRCRQALLFYLLQHLRLDVEHGAKPEAQQVVLKNRLALAPCLGSGMDSAVA
ncbi:MAG TPA: WYL domain-containing protein [Rhodocyclaceae bacterium]|nr:WYL domain-containing protein [Rhodocyclaceae bacterium]